MRCVPPALPRLTLVFSALCALLLPRGALAQGWHWVSPKPQGVAVNAVTFIGGQSWLVGALGTIATTTDGAQTFSAQNSGVAVDLYGVFFLDGQRGWAVGDLGTILHTVDGGQHWRPQPSQASRKLRGVYFTDPLHGVVVGDDRTLLQTQDGGQTWTGRGSALLSLDAVVFTDALHGAICGDTGQILTTDDGGNTFNTIQTSSTVHLLALAFADANHGFAVGQAGAVITTNDGGHSWLVQTVGSDDLVAVVTVSAVQAYALGSSGALYGTSDGSTWAKLETLSAGGLFTALGREPSGALDATASSGQWLRASSSQSPPAFADVNDLLPASATATAVAFGSVDAGVLIADGYLYATADRGQHLAQVGPSPGGVAFGWHALSMPTPSDVFAVGINATVAVSHDSGQTWQLLANVPAGNDDLLAVQFFDVLHGVVAGANGVVLSTVNGGTTWTPFTSMVTTDVTALAFLDPQHGVVGGNSAEVQWTLDGKTLSTSKADFGRNVLAAAYPATGVALVGGNSGALAHSLDQGLNFFDLTAPSQSNVTALLFLDHQNGYLAVGPPVGTIFVTHDAAQSFGVQFTGATSVLALSFPKQPTGFGNGFAVGAGGALLATQSGGEAVCHADADCGSDAGVAYGFQCLAGACRPCTEDARCGPSCQPCQSPTPTCYGGYCAACLSDLDCASPGYCVLGLCQLPSQFDGGPRDAGSPLTSDAGAPDAGGGSSSSTGRVPPPTCDPSSGTCPPSGGCGCAGGTGTLAGAWLALALLTFFLPRRRARG